MFSGELLSPAYAETESLEQRAKLASVNPPGQRAGHIYTTSAWYPLWTLSLSKITMARSSRWSAVWLSPLTILVLLALFITPAGMLDPFPVVFANRTQ